MGRVLSLVAVCLMVGCGASRITVYKFVDGEEVPKVEVVQRFAGKGCVAVDSSTDGSTSVIVQQAGTSDWSISRAFGFLGDIAGNVFGGDRGMNEMQGPATGMQGCEGLFMTEPVEKPVPVYLMTPVETDE